jgi:hypothetical protein
VGAVRRGAGSLRRAESDEAAVVSASLSKARLRPSVSTAALRSPELKFETRPTPEIGYAVDLAQKIRVGTEWAQ